MENTYNSLAPGYWRGALQLVPKEIVGGLAEKSLSEIANNKLEEITPDELPFIFELIYDDEANFHLEIINGSERIRVDSIIHGHSRKTGKDSIVIFFPVYESYIKAFYNGNVMQGEWVVTTKENYSIPFTAHNGRNQRFTDLTKAPMMDVSGKWACTFGLDGEDPYPAIGEFQQSGNKVTGTFRTETGDYRFLEGSIQEDKLYLSCFDGAHAFLFEAKILEDQSMIGSFRSGKHYRTTWEAKKEDSAQLGDPDSLTYLLDGYETIEFAFENENGEVISLDNPAYQDKIKIVQIFGTWCPNCRDETEFLTSYLRDQPNEDLAVIA
ncbi:MAG: TlpA family protein disulfide reductase, partial [Bacteroidota bacterium]